MCVSKKDIKVVQGDFVSYRDTLEYRNIDFGQSKTTSNHYVMSYQ